MSNRPHDEIIERMSTFSNAFKVLAGTALIGYENIGWKFIFPIILFALTDLYYFYLELKERDLEINGSNNTSKFRLLFNAFKSISFIGYY